MMINGVGLQSFGWAAKKPVQIFKAKGFNANLQKSFLQKDSVVFKSKLQNDNNLPLEITQKLKGNATISDIIKKSIDDENIIGKGANSTAYRMPELDDYVLKVLNKQDPNKINMSEFPSSVNLGQPIWQSEENPKIIILKKVNGTEHSIANWSDVIWDDAKKTANNVTDKQAKLFSEQIKNIASMPQSSFDSIAKDAKYLDDKGYKIDSINPNNLIVDNKKNEMHIIDYYKIKPQEKHIQQNSYLDLIALMLDFTLFPEYFDKLSDSEKQNAIEAVKTITKKAEKASIKAGLSCDETKFKTYVKHVAKWFFTRSVPKSDNGDMYFRYYDVRMFDFLDMLKNPQEWASKR